MERSIYNIFKYRTLQKKLKTLTSTLVIYVSFIQTQFELLDEKNYLIDYVVWSEHVFPFTKINQNLNSSKIRVESICTVNDNIVMEILLYAIY